MIYIFSAFYAEAKNIIDHYGLKKEKSPEMVRFDVFANESIRLVITGVGEINAAAAVSNIGGAYGISPDDEILNVGCGAGFSSDICLGSIFLGNKLTEQMTGRTFYPDMLMKANFRESQGCLMKGVIRLYMIWRQPPFIRQQRFSWDRIVCIL